MSSKGTRKSAVAEEKEKRTDSPVKDMKKKVAANSEQDKQVPDKTVKSPERSDKNAEKPEKVQAPNEKGDSKKVDKTQNEKDAKKAEKTPNDKVDNKKADKNVSTPEKNPQKPDKNASTPDKSSQKADKSAEKNDKNESKKADKVNDKKEKPAEKKNEEKKEEAKADTNVKDKPEKTTQNGASNGDANGADTVSEPDSSEEELLVIDDQDEVFPELTYDESSDVEVEDAPSRSFTRRSQVKATKTPETPRPASFKEDDSKEKLLKVTDSLATDRKLRSADSPKPEAKKAEPKEKTIDLTEDDEKETEKSVEGKKDSKKVEMDVVVEVEGLEGEVRARTRARVSPYTRPRLDQTTSSVTANYTGNNTTMEMDITETSSILEEPLDDSGYLRGLRAIRGRASYKPLKELHIRHTINRSLRSNTSANTSVSEAARPTGTVVGRKRKPDADEIESLEPEVAEAVEALEAEEEATLHSQSKRMRLFDRFSQPFRGFNSRRAAEIVGINTDLPLTAPVACPPAFLDPETLKPAPAPSDPVAVPLPPRAHDRDAKKCAIV